MTDLTDQPVQLRIRPLRIEDFERLLKLQALCFPGMEPSERKHVEAQIETFPDGQLVAEYEGEVVASASSLIVNYRTCTEWHDWETIAGGGYISNHTDDGDTLYGIEIMVHPDFRGQKLSRRLYDARKQICRRRNLRRIVVGGRIPGYHKHADELTAREYIEQVIQKSLYDPVLTMQLSNGFVLQEIIPNYYPEDTHSRGYATFLEWPNLDYLPNSTNKFTRAVSLARICVVQYQMRRISSFEDFETQCEFFIDVASGYKSDFVLFPELLTTQLLSLVEAGRPEESARAVATFTEPYLNFFQRMAMHYNINIIGGTHLVVEEGRLLNVAFLFRRDGTVERQEKIHITPAERQWWGVQPGDEIKVFTTDKGKIAIPICYDVEFPEFARIATAKGARILFVPFNTDERHGYLRVRVSAQARCIENQIFTAIAGCTGNLPFVDNVDIHYAQSGIFSPSDFSFARDGVVAECTPNIETVVIHDVDLQALRLSRLQGTVQNWKDRRKDLYQVAYKEGDDERRM